MKNKIVFASALVVSTGAFMQSVYAEPGLTIYNQNFAVVRQDVPLDLKAGENRVQLDNITSVLEPDSVVLRDPSGKVAFKILEQNYRADPISVSKLLSQYEGKTLDFLVDNAGQKQVVKGKVIRSGYSPSVRYAGDDDDYQSVGSAGTPIIEVDGTLRFKLPGEPLFPALTNDSILKPQLNWLVQSQQGGKLNAELAYITGGLSWTADYNIVSPETGDTVDVTGWVTMSNYCGRDFENAAIKLMAGDISKLNSRQEYAYQRALRSRDISSPQAVSEKTFDEYHLYTLQRPATLRDKETKQVEFIRATGVKSQRIYVYDGMQTDANYDGYEESYRRTQANYGTKSNTKVWVMREIKNSKENGLGIPLPKGQVRFYRRDGVESGPGNLEFIGENTIDHTPANELLRIYTGNAFDIAGERRQTSFKLDSNENQWADESFEIKLRNHKKEPVEVRIVEHLYRGANWAITQKTNAFVKTDARTVEFRVLLAPEENKTLTYTVHYSW